MINKDKKVLFVTVGGSPEPIIASIDHFKPNEIVFICSNGSKLEVPKILSRTTDKVEEYKTLIVDEDNIDEITHSCQTAFRERINLGANILADFTGGTKCMSFSLASSAAFYGVPIRFMGGKRIDLGRIESDTSQPMKFNYAWLEYEVAKKSFNAGHYFAAFNLLSNLVGGIPFQKLADDIEYLRTLAHGFDYWDKFQHVAALKLLRTHSNRFPQQIHMLQRIVNPETRRDAHRYELLFDLMANAKRCANKGKFDDACARLYRAVEYLAQKRLLTEHNIDTSKVDKTILPQEMRVDTKYLTVMLARDKAYELLTHIDSAGLGDVYMHYKDRLNNNMKLRNYSILAHGFEPISGAAFRQFCETVEKFFIDAFDAIGVTYETLEFPEME